MPALAIPRTVATADELDSLLPGTIIRLADGLAALKRNGIDWYIANDEAESFTGECIEMNDYAMPATVVWEPTT